MPFPAGTPTVTLIGTLPSAVGGGPYSGTIVLTPSTELIDAERHAIYPGGGTVALDQNGAFSVQLIPNDAAGIEPVGWRWRIDLQPAGGARTIFWTDIHGPDGTTVHLDELLPVPAPDGTPGVQQGPAGASAYELAVADGYTGTVTQWLASLVGPAGQTGQTGPQPPLGAAGAGSTVALRSDDPSTTNARTPTAHAATHVTGGSDALTAADIGALATSGGAISGALIIDRFGAPTYPIGQAGAVASLNVPSSYAGGDDNGSGTDTTGRINLYSYQRANVGSFGETVRKFAMRSDAKTMEAFYIPVDATKKGGYDPATRDPKGSGVSWKPVVWAGSHYEANDHASIHGHWELEIADLNGALQGRLEIPFIDQPTDGTKPLDQATIGVAYTNIRTNLADLSVRAQNMTAGPYSGQNTALRVGGNNSVNKELHLSISSDMGTSGRRWVLRANNTTEDGSNAGTDFQLLAYDNAGTLITQALHAERKTGNIGLGTVAPDARLHVKRSTGQVLHLETGAASQSALLVDGFDATVKAMQAQVAGDTSKRFQVLVDGAMSWGPGSAATDTTLYRANTGRLKTDTAFHVGTNMLVNTTSTGGGVGVVGMANATTIPASNPTGGGVLYVNAGALVYRGPSGTITTLAPA